MGPTARTSVFSWAARRMAARLGAGGHPVHARNGSGLFEKPGPTTLSLPDAVDRIRQALGSPPDLVIRPLGPEGPWVLFLHSLADVRLVADAVVRPLLTASGDGRASVGPDSIEVPNVDPVKDEQTAVRQLLDGHTILVERDGALWTLTTAKRPGRAVEEPSNETGIRVPREGFTEELEVSIALIRARLRHPGLRLEERRCGTRTGTRVILAYMEDIIDPEILSTVRQRLDRIQLDGVLESGYVEEFIEDAPFSPFPQVLRTERPDVVVANLLEGRFAILVDGTPFALIGPVVLPQMLLSAEDYYERTVLTSWVRWLRFAAFVISLTLPGLYVAVTSFHPEVIPTPLLFSIAGAREGIPFPPLVEAILMELQFEMLREAGLRLPRTVGPAISIVGALVLGEAAFRANIVSPAMVIVVAMTGIASFTAPLFSIAMAARLLRFAFTIAGGVFGLLGLQAVGVLLVVHLCALRSFGVPYLSPMAPLRVRDWSHVVARPPWWATRTRPAFVLPKDLMRAPSSGRRGGGHR
ncbi:MAG TPA: spore germination protein [Limnochordales bacterium]